MPGGGSTPECVEPPLRFRIVTKWQVERLARSLHHPEYKPLSKV